MLPRRATVALFLPLLLFATVVSAQAASTPSAPTSAPDEIRPLKVLEPQGISRPPSGLFSQRTLRVAIEVDRDSARLVLYTLKDTPFIRPLETPEPDPGGVRPWVEVALLGPEGKRYTRSFDISLCFEHAGNTPPHVVGDQVQRHRDIFVIELPELAGFDRIGISTTGSAVGTASKARVEETLDEAHFTPAGGKARYRNLVFAAHGLEGSTMEPSSEAPQPRGVIWPEDIGDPDIYRVNGVEAEGARRINVVVVPDAYLTTDKTLMINSFDRISRLLVSPLAEHASLINFVLVFAYSVEDGPDQCDCGITHDTAMGTGFPDLQPPYEGCAGHSCLTTDPGCGQNNGHHIAEAELRAPFLDHSMGDFTVVMVHSDRWGGCGCFGCHTVVVSANMGALPTMHEMGHSWAGLADEYFDHFTCGNSAGEVNTSMDSQVGAWPEWIADLGAPIEGGGHFQYCVYKPVLPGSCLMGTTTQGLPCPVCTQQWALVLYGSERVSPTAPIDAMSPPPAVSTQSGTWSDFTVTTRLPSGGTITNEIVWQIQGPGSPTAWTIAMGIPTLRLAFDLPGQYSLTAKVIADANLIKPVRYGPNVDVATWNVSVAAGPPPLEVSPPGSVQPLTFTSDAALLWEDGALNQSAAFNLYRGAVADLAQGSHGACLASSLLTNTASDAAQPPLDQAWFYLVAGRSSGTIGTLGQDSSGSSRGNGAACP